MSDISDPVISKIAAVRARLLFESIPLGTIIFGLEPVEDERFCSVSTDGEKLYYNHDFVVKLTQPELVFALGNIALHIKYDDLTRCGSRDYALFNMAADYRINWVLTKSKIGEMPSGGLYDERFTDAMTTEEIYDILKLEFFEIPTQVEEI